MSLRRVWVLLGLLLLAGCDTLPTMDAGEVTPPVETARSDAAETGKLLAYYARVRQLPAAELAKEQEAARRALARTRNDANRVRYALLQTLPGTPPGEELRALELLEPVTRNGDGALRGLALLMTSFLQEQRRLETSVHGLQQKLDALLTLERNMTGRDGGGTRKR